MKISKASCYHDIHRKFLKGVSQICSSGESYRYQEYSQEVPQKVYSGILSGCPSGTLSFLACCVCQNLSDGIYQEFSQEASRELS